ncbi:MAG: hypothetical protein QGH60_03935 [Phycisphaerae bacterium]|jgi:hypothetical protein|nr:hypothetical protein [Phycisphaerae bacterium]
MVNLNMLGLFGGYVHWTAIPAVIVLVAVLIFWKKYRDSQM